MTFIFKKAVPELDTYCSRVLAQIETAQERRKTSALFGNYTSTRYHRYLPIRRKEDNVYFVSWINQLLDRNLDQLPSELTLRARILIDYGDRAIEKYRNRYGESTYNFYRPKAWFPNGRLLSKFGQFQPTDDTDDTSIAFRGKKHAKEEAVKVKEIFKLHVNGRRGRWLQRIPKHYRSISCYSTWIGSDSIYVDTDIVVLSNILMFSARYSLELCHEDEASLLLIRKAILSGDYLKRKWSLSAWYPFDAVILYSLSDLVSLEYFDELHDVREQLIRDLNRIECSKSQIIQRLIVDSALMKLGQPMRFGDDLKTLESEVIKQRGFSFGVIPLLHPWNGSVMQYLSSFSFLRLYYDCAAQRSAILLEHILLRKSRLRNLPEKRKRRARSYKPDSVILNQ